MQTKKSLFRHLWYSHLYSLLLLQDGCTALHLAAHNGQTAAVSLLLKKKADIEAKTNVSKPTYHDIKLHSIYLMHAIPALSNLLHECVYDLYMLAELFVARFLSGGRVDSRCSSRCSKSSSSSSSMKAPTSVCLGCTYSVYNIGNFRFQTCLSPPVISLMML